MTSPTDALQRLRDAEATGRLQELAERHGLRLVVAFGSAVRGEAGARDLDVAVASRTGELDAVVVVSAFMDLLGIDAVDLLDLDRAGPVARQHALVTGEPLYETPAGEYVREQMRASAERLSTEWMRRLDLELMAEPS